MKKEKSDERRVITTAKMPRKEVAEVPEGALKGGGFIQTGPKMTDGEFIVRYGTEDELAGLARLIRERRKARPQNTHWLCPKCGWRAKLGPDMAEPLPCIRCNMARYKDSGWLRRMTVPEAKQFEADTAASERKAIERLRKMHFAEVNRNRIEKGLDPQTREQFDADSRHAAELQRRRAQEITRLHEEQKKAQLREQAQG